MAQLTLHRTTAGAIWYTHDGGITSLLFVEHREHSGVIPSGEQPARVQVSRGSDISICNVTTHCTAVVTSEGEN
jgi:hypothetical protein